jgi:integrase
VADWLGVRGDEGGALFVAVNKSGRITNYKNMTPKTIYKMLAKRATEAGVKSFSPHDLRRSFISDLLDAGADITNVSKLAGHASVTTTSRYDRRPEEAQRKAASLLHVPYAGRA